MIGALLWAAIQPREIGYEHFDRVVFSTRITHQPQLLGFDQQRMTTRYEYEMIFKRRSVNGGMTEVERHSVTKYPQLVRANDKGEVRFCFVSGEWDGNRESHQWRRIHAREVWSIVNIYHLEAE